VSLAPVPEVREMVEVARRFVAGEVHFSFLVGPTEACLLWATIHGAHPAIDALAAEWQSRADRVWNEWRQHGPGVHPPVEEFRRRVAADLGLAPDAERHRWPAGAEEPAGERCRSAEA
jgi:hypothetical protein